MDESGVGGSPLGPAPPPEGPPPPFGDIELDCNCCNVANDRGTAFMTAPPGAGGLEIEDTPNLNTFATKANK